MTRQLRSRKSRSNYALIVGLNPDEGSTEPLAGPSTPGPAMDLDDADSGSDFSPGNEKEAGRQAQQDAEDDEELVAYANPGSESGEQPLNLITDIDFLELAQPTAAAKNKATTTKAKDRSGLGAGLPRTKRQMYTLPTPSVHHRHRAVPLYSRDGRVERLKHPPELFRAPGIVMTNGFTQPKVMERVNKAWGYNVGPGPMWEMVEDRGWFKEGETLGESEGSRRPVVHRDVAAKHGWQILNREQATPYLPTDTVTTEEGSLRPPPPLMCYFGPYNAQTRVDVDMFEAHPMVNFLSESKAHVFNPGAPAWGIDWCPIHQGDRLVRDFKQYLAVAPFPSAPHSPEIGVKVSRPSYACIQLWSLSQTSKSEQSDSTPGNSANETDVGFMECEMVLCIESGPAYDLKWCPLPSHDVYSDTTRPRKLGIIAGTFEDGSLSIYAVPQPEDLKSAVGDPSSPIYVKSPAPLIRIEMEETCCWSLDWANSEQIAVGTTNGVIAVYNIGPSLHSMTTAEFPVTDLLPTHYLTVHQSAIRALAWIRAPSCSASGTPALDKDPTVIVSGAYDGMECMTDIREGHGNVMNRTRDVINTVSYSAFGGGPVTIDHENIVKAYSASPSMLGRGHMLLEPQGPVWSTATSEWHPQLAVGSADGSCLTTNMLRSTRRSGSVPFFVHKIFQMDYRRNTGEYRMLDRFLPQETQDRPAASRAANKPKPTSSKTTNKNNTKAPASATGAWPQQVAVHKVTWNSGNGLAASGLLASATSSGLCRVDNLWGRWMRDKVPYGGIEHVRREGMEDDMDVVDSEGEDLSVSE